MAKQKSPPDKKEIYSSQLRCELTTEEVAQRANRSATLIAERDAKEQEQKAAAKHAKGVIESIDAEIRTLSGEVRSRATYRPVQCERRYVYKSGRMVETRLDTSEVITDRRLTDAERQLHLPFTESENGEAEE
jgi:hypothetical protein